MKRNYKYIPDFSFASALHFDQLSETAKATAINDVIQDEIDGLVNLYNKRKQMSLNKRINSRSMFQIVDKINLINRLKSDTAYVVKMIKSNQCLFTQSGDYILFSNDLLTDYQPNN